MATPQEVKALYNALISSGNISYATLPDAAVAITLTSKNIAWTYDAWAEIAATVGAVDGWLAGIAMDNPSAPLAQYDVDIGTGGAGAEASVAEIPYYGGLAWLPFPPRIVAATRIAARCRSSLAVADTMDVKVVIAISVQ